MGDSIATAILTTTMFLVDVLAVYNRKLCTTPRLLHEKILEGLTSRGESKFIEALSGVSPFGSSIKSARIPSYEEFLDILAEMREMPIRNVGDDKVIPHYLEPYVRDILSRIGTTVNEDKSSTKGSYHKETCGCWVISDGKETMEIFPFRAPEGDTRPLKLQAATEFLQRISRSTSIPHFTAALAYAYGPELTASSYRSDQIGSPEGVGLPCVITQQSNILLARVDDDLAYVFNLKSDDWSDSVSRELPNDGTCSSFEHFIPYRISKRSNPSRVRFRGFRDPSKPKGLRVPKNYEVVFNSNLMGDDSETASLREHRRWSARWLESFVSASCEAILDIW